jgi:hypothetical protein
MRSSPGTAAVYEPVCCRAPQGTPGQPLHTLSTDRPGVESMYIGIGTLIVIIILILLLT